MYKIPKRFREKLLARFDLNNFTAQDDSLRNDVSCILCAEYRCPECPVHHCADILIKIFKDTLGPDDKEWGKHVKVAGLYIEVFSRKGEETINAVYEWLQDEVEWTE